MWRRADMDETPQQALGCCHPEGACFVNPRVGVITAVVLATAACTAVGISENDLDFRVESRIQSVRQDAVGSQALTCSFWVVLETRRGRPNDSSG